MRNIELNLLRIENLLVSSNVNKHNSLKSKWSHVYKISLRKCYFNRFFSCYIRINLLLFLLVTSFSIPTTLCSFYSYYNNIISCNCNNWSVLACKSVYVTCYLILVINYVNTANGCYEYTFNIIMQHYYAYVYCWKYIIFFKHNS